MSLLHPFLFLCLYFVVSHKFACLYFLLLLMDLSAADREKCDIKNIFLSELQETNYETFRNLFKDHGIQNDYYTCEHFQNKMLTIKK